MSACSVVVSILLQSDLTLPHEEVLKSLGNYEYYVEFVAENAGNVKEMF